jgi:hypothetical protein
MKRATTIAAALTATAALLFTAASIAASSLPTLTLAMSKNKIVVGGEMVSGAVQIKTTVSGEAVDEPTLLLLKPGVTLAQFGKIAASLGPSTPLDVIDPYATIVFDGQDVHKGKTDVEETVLPAGTYVAVDDGSGHTPFAVSASSTPAKLPKAQATITAIDFAFRGAAKIHDGEMVRFQNHGFLIHMFLAVRVHNVADARKAEKALRADKIKTVKHYALSAPFDMAGPLSTGQKEQYVIRQHPGVYVIFCGMNAQDGREHFELGMYRTIRILK